MCQKCVQRLEEFHEFYQEISQNQEILLYSQPITSSSQIIITNDLSKSGTSAGFIQLPIGFNVKGLLTLQANTENEGTFDLVDGATAIDFQQFVTDVEADNDLIIKEPEQFSAIEVIDSCPVKLIVESPSSSNDRKTVDDSPINILPQIKEESVENVIDNNLLHRTLTDDGNTTSNAPETIKMKPNKTTRRKQRLRKKNAVQAEVSTPKPEQIQMTEMQANDLSEQLKSSFKIDENIEASVQEDIDALANSIDDDHIIGEGEESDADDVSIDNLDMDNERFEGFPKYMIKDSKLIVRGTQLMELMSKFYRLECDVCSIAG